MIFDQDGRQLAILLDGPDRRVTAISCREQIITSPPRPALLDVRIGNVRGEVLPKIGPDPSHLVGQRERPDHSKLVAVFELQDGQVVQITLGTGLGKFRPWPTLL